MPSRSRSSHAGKTLSERSAYQRYIRQLESQPTISEPTGIDPSFAAKEEFTEPVSRRERVIPLTTRILEHLEKNWITWLFGALIFIAGFLVYDAKTNITVLSHDLSSQQQSLDKIDVSLDENAKADHTRDLMIQELRIRIEYLANETQIPPATNTPTKSPTSTPTQNP